MGRLGLIATCAALIAATSTQAQVTDVTGEGDNVFTIQGGTFPLPLSEGSLTFGTANGASFQSVVDIGSEFISFENGNAVSGPFISTKSSSIVDITFLNGGQSAVTPVLSSTIIPAGMGFYLSDRSSGCGGNVYQGCPESQAGYTFSDLASLAAPGQPTAFAGFEFSVVSGNETLYTLSGSMQMVYDPVSMQMVVSDTLDPARSALSGFTLATPDGSGSAIGYAWDATDILLNFATPMAAGESRTLSYITTVTSYTRADCIDSATCLVAYSGFGDPVGRGGGVASFALGMSALAEEGIENVVFEPSVFRRPTFENGVLTFKLASAVPEPTTWLTSILGFAIVGTAVRRRRRTALLA